MYVRFLNHQGSYWRARQEKRGVCYGNRDDDIERKQSLGLG